MSRKGKSTELESVLLVPWGWRSAQGLIAGGSKGYIWGGGNSLKLNCGGCTADYWSVHLKPLKFIVYELYHNEAV